MYFFGGIEAVKQFQYISVKLTDIGYFRVEPHTFTSKNLIGTDFHSPANKDRELFQAFGRTVQIQVTVISYPTYAQFKFLPSYGVINGWNSKSKRKSLIELCLFTF